MEPNGILDLFNKEVPAGHQERYIVRSKSGIYGDRAFVKKIERDQNGLIVRAYVWVLTTKVHLWQDVDDIEVRTHPRAH
jgi:hypothetical protein